MSRESHIPHHRDHHFHHEDPESPPEPFGTGGGPNEPGPGRGRGHRRGGGRGRPGSPGPGGTGFGGPGFGGPGFGGPGGPPFGPSPQGIGPRGRRRRPKGAVREAVLSLLAIGPANGYSLMRQIAERTDGAWTPSPGSVYPTLSQLVDEGLIQATGVDRGTDFVLTDEGRQYVSDHADALEQVWAEATHGAPSHAAMRDSLMALMGVAHQFRFATDEQRQRASELLDEARRALHGILAE
ncbi:MAG: PadR family transcriptional regulator [Candidatus Nanopelagicales bacterium]